MWSEYMDEFLIYGGNKLFGELEIGSSKNATLPILAATILCDKKITIHKFPKFQDTLYMLKILECLGAKCVLEQESVTIDPSGINKHEIDSYLASRIRSSIFSLGAILSRLKKAKVAYPGGCAIGARPIDLHIKGLESLGVKIQDKHGFLYCDGKDMKSGTISLDFPSVGATENIILASVFLKGTTKIINCAREPEIVDLANFLNSLGAKVHGAGTSVIEIEGVTSLNGGEYTPISDRIIAGTYMIATCMCGGKTTLKNINPDNVYALLAKLKNNCCKMSIKGDKITLSVDKLPKAISKIETQVFPGFPTDLQPQIVAMLSIAKGTSVVVENLFESRFKYTSELKKLGADIIVKDKTAIIKGVSSLYGAKVCACDLRGGAAMVLAGLVANGYTTVYDVNHIDRGYYHIEQDLKTLGANIERISKV